MTLRELILKIGFQEEKIPDIRSSVSGTIVREEYFASFIPPPGAVVTLNVVPGDPVTDAIIVFFGWLASFKVAGVVGGALEAAGAYGVIGGTGIFLVEVATGALIVAGTSALAIAGANSLVKAPSGGFSGGTSRGSPTLTGTRNVLRPFEPVWRIFGKMRVTPPLGAKSFTEVQGGEQYFRMLFLLGYGPLEIDEDSFRIGETDLSAFSDVQYEVRQGFAGEAPLTLFTDTVREVALNIDIRTPGQESGGIEPRAAGDWATRSTEPLTSEVLLDISWPRGLIIISDKGKRTPASAWFQLQTRVPGGSWADTEPGDVNLPKEAVFIEDGAFGTRFWDYASPNDTGARIIAFQGSTTEPFITGIRIRFDEPRVYEIRLRKWWVTGYHTKLADSLWISLKSIEIKDPIDIDGMAKIAMRIKATDQLRGSVDSFNCIATSMLPTYDGATWSDPVATQNPAWAYAEVLRGSANKRPIPDARVDADAIQLWAEEMDSQARQLNGVVDFESTVLEILSRIASAHRASFNMRDGKFSVVVDKARDPVTEVVQHWTPRNSFGFSATRTFPDVPHGLRVQFLDEDEDYVRVEDLVFDDGFDRGNATKFETLELWGVTNENTARRDARFHLAQVRLRPEVYTFSTDIEYMVAERGDLCLLTHDVPLFGSGFARIKTVTESGGNAISATVDDTLTYENGKNYSVRLRLRSGADVNAPVDNPAPAPAGTLFESSTITFTTPITPPIPEEDDLVQFGETGTETAEVIITAIEPREDLTATITCVDHAPGVYTAEESGIPPYESNVTPAREATPPIPIILDTYEDVSGFRVVVNVQASGVVGQVGSVELQYRGVETDFGTVEVGDWVILQPTSMVAGRAVASTGSLIKGETYELRIRSISVLSVPSAFVTVFPEIYRTFIGDAQPVLSDFEVSGLELVSQGNDSIFGGRDPKFTWRLKQLNVPDVVSGPVEDQSPFDTLTPGIQHQSYEIRITDTDTGLVVGNGTRIETTTNRSYTYTFERNRFDSLVDGVNTRRSFGIEVRYQDLLGKVSPPQKITVSNPAPEIPSGFKADAVGEAVVLSFDIPPDIDYSGTLVHRNELTTFTPSQINIVGNQTGSPITVHSPGATFTQRYSMDSDAANWSTSLGTDSDESSIKVEGSGSLKFTISGAGGGGRVFRSFTTEDWTDKLLKFWAYPSRFGAQETPYQLDFWLKDSAGKVSQWFFSDKRNAQVPTANLNMDEWQIIDIDPDDPDFVQDLFDQSDVVEMDFKVSGQSGFGVYLDDVTEADGVATVYWKIGHYDEFARNPRTGVVDLSLISYSDALLKSSLKV